MQKANEISPRSTAELGKCFGVNSPLLFQAPNEEFLSPVRGWGHICLAVRAYETTRLT